MLGMSPAARLSLRLGVDNLLDEATWYPDATFGAVNSLPWRPGRVVFAGLTLNWGGQ
jgi:outer membrane receptor protein involved in Fe transport